MSTPTTETEHVQRIPLLEYAGDAAGRLTVKQAALYMSLHPKTVQKMCTARRIECRKIGRGWMIDRAVIKAWISSRTQEPINPTGRRWAA